MRKIKGFVSISPQSIIGLFLLILVFAAHLIGMNMISLLNASFIKFTMNGIFVLSLLPMLNAGMGMNFGLPVSICAGLIGMCIAVNFKILGMTGILVSMLLGAVIAILFGKIYAYIMMRIKGKEEIAGTFIGFAFIPLMNFFWSLVPFTNRQMLYPIGGSGLRPRIGLNNYFANILDDAFLLRIGHVEVPLGLICIYLLIGGFLTLLYKTSIGKAMQAVGENEKFVRGSGVNISFLKELSVCISFIIGAIGICVYAQSYGFLELYDAPLTIALPAISALLIGGATAKRGTVKQALVGTYMFQSVFLLSVPIANELLLPEVSEIMRSIITYGMILYALLMSHKRLTI